jgi:signal transduction protein with GAF and PtsI domain
VGLGFRELSLSPISLPDVKRVIRGIRMEEAEKLADTCLQAAGPDEVLAEVDAWFESRPNLLPDE